MSEVLAPLAFKFSLLRFIERTAAYAEEVEDIRGWYDDEYIKKNGYTALLDESKVSINKALMRVGGLETTVPATAETRSFQALLIGWGGLDPDNPSNHEWVGIPLLQKRVQSRHLWQGMFAPSIGLSLEPVAIDKIRLNLLSDIKY